MKINKRVGGCNKRCYICVIEGRGVRVKCVYCTVLYCTVQYCILYCTVLNCTVLYCTVLCCAVLCCTVLYCTVLYCTYTWAILRDLFCYTVSVKKLFGTVSIQFIEQHTTLGIPIYSSNKTTNLIYLNINQLHALNFL